MLASLMSLAAELFVDTKFHMTALTFHCPLVDLVSGNCARRYPVNASTGGSASTRPLPGVTHGRDMD